MILDLYEMCLNLNIHQYGITFPFDILSMSMKENLGSTSPDHGRSRNPLLICVRDQHHLDIIDLSRKKKSIMCKSVNQWSLNFAPTDKVR